MLLLFFLKKTLVSLFKVICQLKAASGKALYTFSILQSIK